MLGIAEQITEFGNAIDTPIALAFFGGNYAEAVAHFDKRPAQALLFLEAANAPLEVASAYTYHKLCGIV